MSSGSSDTVFGPVVAAVTKIWSATAASARGRFVESLSANLWNCYVSGPTFPDSTFTFSQALMNAHLEMDSLEVLRVKLGVLKQEHRDLDEAIHALEASARADHLTLRRLKKQKLALKDQIRRVEDMLTPDIIA